MLGIILRLRVVGQAENDKARCTVVCDVPTYLHRRLCFSPIQLRLHNRDFDENRLKEPVQIEEQEPLQIEQDEGSLMQLSLHALNGSLRPKNYLEGIYKKRLYILLDSGSIHNLVSKQLAHKLGCDLQPVEGVKVIAAYGVDL